MAVQLKIQVNTQQLEIELLGKFFEDTEEALAQAVLFNKLAQDNGFVGRYGFHCYVDRRTELITSERPMIITMETGNRISVRLKELNEACTNSIISGYLSSMHYCLDPYDLTEYRRGLRGLTEYAQENKLDLVWLHELEV